MCYVVIGQENQKQSHVKQLSKEKKDLDIAIKNRHCLFKYIYQTIIR